MIKYIFQLSDIHLRRKITDENWDKYELILSDTVDKIKKAVIGDKSEYRIVITGDLFHDKLDIDNKLMLRAGNFLKQLSSICKVIIIAGNHDMKVSNKEEVDSIYPIANLMGDKLVYLDAELGLQSGCLVDDNIVWCLYSFYGEHKRPFDLDDNLAEFKGEKKFIGLFHEVINSESASLYGMKLEEDKLPKGRFKGLDFILCGHLHNKIETAVDGVKAFYSGSLIQQTFSERCSNHGFAIWSVEKNDYKFINVDGSGFSKLNFVLPENPKIKELSKYWTNS